MISRRRVRKLLRYLSEGDLRTPGHWLLSQFESTAIDLNEGTDTTHATWIRPDGDIIETEYTRDGYRQFALSATVDEEETIALDPDRPFDAIECDVVDVADQVTVKVTYETVDGVEATESITFTNGSFNEEEWIPLSIRLSDPAVSATLSVTSSAVASSRRAWLQGGDRTAKITETPRLTLPSVTPAESTQMPIFFISVDTFRYDALDTFKPVIDAMDGEAIVPDEPRTQGHWTRPSHASTFTGVHPADHGYVAGASDDVPVNRIKPALTTLPEFLSERAYRCSGCVTQPSLSPNYGFRRGFDRFELRNMAWETRRNDAHDVVSTALEWLDQDGYGTRSNLFYFLHLFDGHYPYIPPYPFEDSDEVNVDVVERYRNRRNGDDYLETLRSPAPDISPEEDTLVRSYYHESLTYIARQLRRFIEELKTVGLFEDALIVVIGDHGEGFFDRKFATHATLYDENIRPGTVVKLPASAEFTVPNAVDHVDLFPTVARLLGADPPTQCVGRPWQDGDRNEERARISERIRPDCYNVSVELEGYKGIFTYESGFPSLPSAEQVDSGPLETEFYDLEAVRTGDPTCLDESRDPVLAHRLRERAETFIRREASESQEPARFQPSQEVTQKLAKLGYK